MLNEQQYIAVQHVDGPLLILAGAGAGKTHTLTERVAYLVREIGIPMESILCLTFTNKAAKEMRERIGKKLGVELPQVQPYRESGIPIIGTFHSVGVYFLRMFIDRIGYARNFVIFDEDDKVKLVKLILREKGIDEKEVPAKQVTAAISGAKNEGLNADGLRRTAQSYAMSIAADIYVELERRMREMNALDFDDILLKVHELLKVPEVLAYFQNRFAYIMVDEYQDTNEIQYQIVKMLGAASRNVAVVGDDWQGIYSWRGANIKNIIHFERDYPDAKVVKLEQNYRSTKTVIEAANAVIKNNKEALEKTLWTDNPQGEKILELELEGEREEAREIARLISEDARGSGKYREWAILYRTNSQSRSLEEALITKGIQYRIYGGLKFYERKEIKDMLAYLRLVHNRSDQASFSRIINVPSRKIGDKGLEQILLLANELHADPITAIHHAQNLQIFTGILKGATAQFVDIYTQLSDISRTESVCKLIGKIIELTKYIDYLDIEFGKEESEQKQENLKELMNLASRYDGLEQGEGLSLFLEDIALITDSDREGNDDNMVSLMTVHLAKGLEFKNVVIAGAEDGLFPHSRTFLELKELEEERRLMYVALTRAKSRLYITRAKERFKFGSYSANPRSKFLAEIPPELMEVRLSEPKYQFGGSSWGQYGLGKGNQGGSGGSVRVMAAGSTSSGFKERSQSFGSSTGGFRGSSGGSYGNSYGSTGVSGSTGSLGRSNGSDVQSSGVERPTFVNGDRIEHPQFGSGTIVGLKDDIADIAFSGAHKGIKRMNVRIAPIRKKSE